MPEWRPSPEEFFKFAGRLDQNAAEALVKYTVPTRFFPKKTEPGTKKWVKGKQREPETKKGVKPVAKQ